jgi:hypothetical protein
MYPPPARPGTRLRRSYLIVGAFRSADSSKFFKALGEAA